MHKGQRAFPDEQKGNKPGIFRDIPTRAREGTPDQAGNLAADTVVYGRTFTVPGKWLTGS